MKAKLRKIRKIHAAAIAEAAREAAPATKGKAHTKLKAHKAKIAKPAPATKGKAHTKLKAHKSKIAKAANLLKAHVKHTTTSIVKAAHNKHAAKKVRRNAEKQVKKHAND